MPRPRRYESVASVTGRDVWRWVWTRSPRSVVERTRKLSKPPRVEILGQMLAPSHSGEHHVHLPAATGSMGSAVHHVHTTRSGIEASVVLSLEQRDLDVERRQVHAHGSMTKSRDRIVNVEPWVVTCLRHARRLLPGTPFVPGMNRCTLSDTHRATCRVLGIVDYQLRDARHTFAVWAICAVASFEAVALQLGHAVRK